LNSTFALLTAVAISAIAAACGAPPPNTPADGVASAKPSADAAPTAAPTTSAAATTTASAAKTADPPKPAAAAKMPDFKASTAGADLKAAGFDVDKLVAMKSLKTADKVKLMPTFVKTTGMQCDDCHDKSDKKKATPNVQIAAKMWDEYVVKMKSSAAPLFCDSCHDGKHDFLTRADKEGKENVKKLMESYVAKLSKKQGGDAASCQTCHTDDFEMKIFEKVWKIKKLERPADERS
jgi:hypothetical protein